jgi:hypothetical protein
MLTYEIHPILCDDIHNIDSQPKDYWFLFLFIKLKIVIWYTYFIYDNFFKTLPP